MTPNYGEQAVSEPTSVDSDPESLILNALFSCLCSARIPYAVMRNHETLPESAGGSDLDILVRPIDAAKAKAQVYKAIDRAEGVVIGMCKNSWFFLRYISFGQHYETCR